MDSNLILLIAIIVLALLFDYINGFHDAANAIATIVATRVFSPIQAVIWAASFNFVAYFIAKYILKEFKIGNTIAHTVNEGYVNLEVILAGIIAAIIWNLITWWLAIPSSSSHTLIGGFIGAAVAHAGALVRDGVDVVNYVHVVPIVLFIFLAPLIGLFIAYFVTILILNILKKKDFAKAERGLRRFQLVSSAMFNLGFGGNDAQKVMGIIGAAVIFYHVQAGDAGWIDAEDKFNYFVSHGHWDWIPIASFVVIALGTLSGGWRIVKTMGTKITKVTPLEGVAAETAGAITLYISQFFGIPVSTTHVITGSIIGVGITKRVSAVRWGVTVNLLWAWVLTIPVSALLAALIYYIIMMF